MTRLPYDSDLHDDEWNCIAPYVEQKPGPGRKRTINIREVINALCYLSKTGCQWRMLPHDSPHEPMSPIITINGSLMEH